MTTTADQKLDYRDPDWVATQLGLDKSTVYRYLQDGVLPGIRLGRKWLVSEARLTAWLETETDRQTRARLQAAGHAGAAVDRLRDFSDECRDILRQAHAEARRYGHQQLGEGHVLLAASGLEGSVAAQALSLAGVDVERLRREFEALAPPTDNVVPRRLGRTPGLRRAMRVAAAASRAAGDKEVSALGLIGAILETAGTGSRDLLLASGLTNTAWATALARVRAHGSRRKQGGASTK